jgi:hypothetical protein
VNEGLSNESTCRSRANQLVKLRGIPKMIPLKRLIKAIDEIQIQFDADKSEYIYFHKGKNPINIRVTLIFITNEDFKIVKVRPYPFDRLTPLRGEWDEYFLLKALLNKRETKMSPQTYR